MSSNKLTAWYGIFILYASFPRCSIATNYCFGMKMRIEIFSHNKHHIKKSKPTKVQLDMTLFGLLANSRHAATNWRKVDKNKNLIKFSCSLVLLV